MVNLRYSHASLVLRSHVSEDRGRLLESTVRNAWRGARRVFGFGAAGRLVTVQPDDVFLVSYPRSGNTWLRFLLCNLLEPSNPVDFLDIERRAPDIHVNSNRTLMRLPRPRFLKSHEYFDPRYDRVLYLVRDPREIVVSYYRWHLKSKDIVDGYPAGTYLERFLDGRLDPFGSWQAHVGGWLGARCGDPPFRLFRYEEMLNEPGRVARHLCEFLELERTETEVESATERSSRDHMRNLERAQRMESTVLRRTRLDVPFVGEGLGSRPRDEQEEYLRGAEARGRIEQRFGRLMLQLGYV